ncbi:pyridoxal kinase [Granulosicoccus antarcticus]|uniref:pyridoxal kinase n=1 Tax=Granulosicoccus antarcticus IMCC3135 TaxID=1192854 RepID=A0A2Z2P092_9GAMM|nr:pyridoxal kinase [Granulosicoccus antarcticus]ASJ72834.1 Pyridoxine/pyridoxal/pyridoxamine kinase [Granulosicoccus antarcticus IMCC3135]
MDTYTQSAQPVIVSIQSQLVYGCAGNNAAMPLLQKLGATVYAVPTVLLSNTPHYPTIGGIDMASDIVEELLSRLLDRVPATGLTAILTGYIRDAATVTVVANFIDRIRKENPGIIVLADPVMGDTDLGLFIPEEVAHCVKSQLLSRADICTPNLFEARFIIGEDEVEPQDLQVALRAAGAGISVITGLGLEQGASEVQTVACQGAQRWSTSTPRLDIRPTGTGDLLAAAFLFHWLATRDVSMALQQSVDNVYSIMRQAADMSLQELEPARL